MSSSASEAEEDPTEQTWHLGLLPLVFALPPTNHRQEYIREAKVLKKYVTSGRPGHRKRTMCLEWVCGFAPCVAHVSPFDSALKSKSASPYPLYHSVSNNRRSSGSAMKCMRMKSQSHTLFLTLLRYCCRFQKLSDFRTGDALLHFFAHLRPECVKLEYHEGDSLFPSQDYRGIALVIGVHRNSPLFRLANPMLSVVIAAGNGTGTV